MIEKFRFFQLSAKKSTFCGINANNCQIIIEFTSLVSIIVNFAGSTLKFMFEKYESLP